jgi:1,4-dihydroxy-2-naphthoate octaprenyltransferase
VAGIFYHRGREERRPARSMTSTPARTSRSVPEDRSPFSGGKRVLVRGCSLRARPSKWPAAAYARRRRRPLDRRRAREPRVLWLGLVGAALAFFYHAPPLRLSYRGGGELAVAIAYGPLIAEGTYPRAAGAGRAPPLLWLSGGPRFLDRGLPLGQRSSPTARPTKPRASGRSWSRAGSAAGGPAAYGALVAVPYLLLVGVPLIGSAPHRVWLGFLGLPFGLGRLARIPPRSPRSRPGLIPARPFSLLGFLLFSAGVSVGACDLTAAPTAGGALSQRWRRSLMSAPNRGSGRSASSLWLLSKSGKVLVAQAHRPLHPLEGLLGEALHGVERSQPEGDVVVGHRDRPSPVR